MTNGLFITVEGIEGSGKSTQLEKLAQAVRAANQNVVVTKEPGGTPLGNRVRAILLDPQEEGMDALAELFLYAASRRQHVMELIRPSLERGAVVLCDRFTDATLAYQGFGRMLELDRLRAINEWATGGLKPDLTIVYDLPEEHGLDRARERNVSKSLHGESRFEGEDLRFHRRVREGYLTLVREEPQRFVVVDAVGSVDEVAERTLRALSERVPRLGVGAPSGS